MKLSLLDGLSERQFLSWRGFGDDRMRFDPPEDLGFFEADEPAQFHIRDLASMDPVVDRRNLDFQKLAYLPGGEQFLHKVTLNLRLLKGKVNNIRMMI